MACDELPNDKPYWNFEDIGLFFLVLVLASVVLRLFVRFHLLARSELNNPGVQLQSALIASLSTALYLVIKLRHHRPVLRPLGWIWPTPPYALVAPLAGMLLAFGVAFYVRVRNQSMAHPHIMELLLLAFLLGPILEESFFRGCLLPLLARATGNFLAVILTGLLFACPPADRFGSLGFVYCDRASVRMDAASIRLDCRCSGHACNLQSGLVPLHHVLGPQRHSKARDLTLGNRPDNPPALKATVILVTERCEAQ